jgi:hypothetical protein
MSKQYQHQDSAAVPLGYVLLAQNPSGVLQAAQCDSSGNIKTTGSGGGGGGTSEPDEAAFVAGTTPGVPIMGYDSSTGEVLIAALSPGTRILEVAGTFSSSPPTSSTASSPAQKTVGTSAGSILASNGSRKGCSVQNTGTTVIKLGLGANPSGTAYHIALRAGGGSDDGSSERWDGTISGVLWQGAVDAISSAAGGTCVVTELT